MPPPSSIKSLVLIELGHGKVPFNVDVEIDLVTVVVVVVLVLVFVDVAIVVLCSIKLCHPLALSKA